MPFSATRDAESYWRSRYGLPPGSNNGSQGPEPRKSGKARKRLHFRKPVFSITRTRGVRIWFVLAALAVSGGAYLFLAQETAPSGNATPLPAQKAALPQAPGNAAPGGAEDFKALLEDFDAAREASLVALRGYLLTEGPGFQREWLQATVRLQAAAEAFGKQSSTWTDGRRLVQLVEMQRLVGRLLAEERAAASIIGTVNRYPGLQLYAEDVQPALSEAQSLCAEVMNAMLAISSPDVVGPIGPFAEFRGDLDDLRGGLVDYMGARSDTGPPVAASDERLDAMRETLAGVRPQVPAEMQAKIDRIGALLTTVEEKLSRTFALRESERWDYANYAFRTRIGPLAEKLKGIAAEWRGSADGKG